MDAEYNRVCMLATERLDRIEELEVDNMRWAAMSTFDKAYIKELEATIKEWESGAITRDWREVRADRLESVGKVLKRLGELEGEDE